MGKQTGSSSGTVPPVQPSTVPHGASSGDSLPHILVMLSDIKKEIGGLNTKVDRLISDVATHSTKIDELRHQATFIKGAIATATFFFALIGWALNTKWEAILQAVQSLQKAH